MIIKLRGCGWGRTIRRRKLLAYDSAAFKERGADVVLNFPDLIGTINVRPEKNTNKKKNYSCYVASLPMNLGNTD